jgi:hypothetical protein
VHDVRRSGATVFALDQDDPDLDQLAHESLQVSPGTAPFSFDAAQHLVSSAVALDAGPGRFSIGNPLGASRAVGQTGVTDRSLRARLARLLDTVSGTPTE